MRTRNGIENENIIRDFINKYGEVPPTWARYVRDYDNGELIASPLCVRYRYNSFTNFLTKCGYDTKERLDINDVVVGMRFEREKASRRKLYRGSKEDIINTFYNHFKDFEYFDVKILSQEYNKGNIPFAEGIVKRKFGGVNSLLKECGLYHLINTQIGRHLTKKEIIAIFKDQYKDLNNPPLQLEVDELKKTTRFPFSSSMLHRKFGSYAKFLIEAGYTYNKGLYSQKYIAKDGEVCDSSIELNIDKYLHKNNINHIHQPKYKDFIKDFDAQSRADFMLSDGTVVEYFGLIGKERYDKKVRKKVETLKENNIRYIDIYPKDLSKLDVVFSKYLGGVSYV